MQFRKIAGTRPLSSCPAENIFLILDACEHFVVGADYVLPIDIQISKLWQHTMSSATLAPIQLLPAKTIDGRKPLREEVPSDEVLCAYCTAKCCRYFAMPIETPTSVQDLDFIRWYLLHDRASVFIEDETWYLLVHTDCKHLQPNHLCGIYETRPQICRDYATDNCEFDDDAVYEMYFETAEQVAEYMEARFQSSDLSSIRSPEPNPLAVLR